MSRNRQVGPLKIHAKNGTGRAGDILVVHSADGRAEHPRSDRTARGSLAWAAYQGDVGAAVLYTHSPRK